MPIVSNVSHIFDDTNFSQGAKGLKYTLTQCILEALQEEFEGKQLSGNLKNTIKIEETPEVLGTFGDDDDFLYGASDYTIVIEAQRYDIQIYQKTGQIVHTNLRKAGGSARRNQSIIERLKAGKSMNEITREDMKKDLSKGRRIRTYDDDLAGSYADEVDKSGGFSKDHKDYVERCIRKGIEKWKEKYPDLDISSNL